MLYNLDIIRGYAIEAEDGALGSVKDFYFDDQQWTIRYFVVDTGNWLPGKQVLITPGVIRSVDPSRQSLNVSITRQQVEDSPGIDSDQPVSRQYETALHDFYQWPYYWTAIPAAGMGVAMPPAAVDYPLKDEAIEPKGDPHLRSVSEVCGYYIVALDSEIGHVETLLGDDKQWYMPYFIVDTRNWLPGRKVLIATHWIERISWVDRKVFVNLDKNTIKESPEYDVRMPVDRAYEQRLYDHYKMLPYW